MNNVTFAEPNSFCMCAQVVLTIFRKEKFLIGSSAAKEAELNIMNTRMRLVKMWWFISLWQATRILQRERGGGDTEKHLKHYMCVQDPEVSNV